MTPTRLPAAVATEEFDADALLIRHGDIVLLAINPKKPFQSAVNAAMAVLLPDFPNLHLDDVRALIRPVIPDMVELESMLGADMPPLTTSAPCPEPQPATARRFHRGRLGRGLLVAAVAAAGVGAGWGTQQATQQSPAAGSQTTVKTYESDPDFKRFAAAGRMQCETIGFLQAKCTDTDGMVMLGEAAIGPGSTIYTFSYGSERIGLRVFTTTANATTWVQQTGTKATYPRLTQHGRYAMWGTDQARLSEYEKLLRQSERQEAAGQSADSLPMPERLAVLALGTLGADTPRYVVRAPGADQPATNAWLLAVSMVMGDPASTTPTSDPSHGDDIVAAAVGMGSTELTPISEEPVATVIDTSSATTLSATPVTTQVFAAGPAADSDDKVAVEAPTATDSDAATDETDATDGDTGTTTATDPAGETGVPADGTQDADAGTTDSGDGADQPVAEDPTCSDSPVDPEDQGDDATTAPPTQTDPTPGDEPPTDTGAGQVPDGTDTATAPPVEAEPSGDADPDDGLGLAVLPQAWQVAA